LEVFKIYYNSAFVYPIARKNKSQICSNSAFEFQGYFIKHAQVIVISKTFSEENYEENKMNFEGAYFWNGLADSAQIRNWRCPTRGNLHRKVCVLLFWECRATEIYENNIFFTPVKYTLVYQAPCRTTHYCVPLSNPANSVI